MESEIASIRQEYLLTSLSEKDMDENPIIQFQQWFQQAIHASIEDVNAMTLSTVDQHHFPKSRIVLLKGITDGQFVFYTNYQSQKGRQIAFQPRVALNFFWRELQRQVRIEGTVRQNPTEEAEEYFHSRPAESQLGAWASHQSEILDDRATLEKRFEQFKEKYTGSEIPKPPNWGGYAVDPCYMEFWQGRANRLHDRICYEKNSQGRWQMHRLNP